MHGCTSSNRGWLEAIERSGGALDRRIGSRGVYLLVSYVLFPLLFFPDEMLYGALRCAYSTCYGRYVLEGSSTAAQ